MRSFPTIAIQEREDGPLALSQDLLDRAVHVLADPVPLREAVFDYHWNSGCKTVRSDALRVSEDGCKSAT